MARAHLVPRMRPVSSFVRQGQAADVEAVMADGTGLMRDGRVLTMDEPAIIVEADRIARRAWARMFSEIPGLGMPPGLARPA